MVSRRRAWKHLPAAEEAKKNVGVQDKDKPPFGYDDKQLWFCPQRWQAEESLQETVILSVQKK